MRALPCVSDGEAAVAAEPMDRPFDLPAVPTAAFAELTDDLSAFRPVGPCTGIYASSWTS